ncbi:MAG: hypothetical protein NE334_09340 [Lentisphaeraceae bacterium]|nr:hypothetical protein [Lentisphaeraceae bacterium]
MTSAKQSKYSLLQILILVGAAFIVLSIVLPARSCGCSEASPKTKVAAQVRQIAMATEAYYSDYQEFPALDNLNKNNARRKLYYSGPLETHDGEEIHIKVDEDLDGLITFKEETVKAKVLVWTKYKDEMLRSWDK